MACGLHIHCSSAYYYRPHRWVSDRVMADLLAPMNPGRTQHPLTNHDSRLRGLAPTTVPQSQPRGRHHR
jgi:hypothetical protein